MEISSSHESQVTKRGCALRGGKLVLKLVHCLWLGTPGRVFSTPALELTSSFSVSLNNKDLSLYNTKKGWLRSCHSSSQSGLLVYIRELDLRSTSGCSGPRLEARVGSPYQSTSGSQQWVPPTNFIWLKLGLMEVVLCCCFCVFLFERQTINLFSQRSFWDDAGVSACAISDNDNYPARALGLLLADGAPTVGRGKTFWRVN